MSAQEQTTDKDMELIKMTNTVLEAHTLAEKYIVDRELRINALEREILEAKKKGIEAGVTSLAARLTSVNFIKLVQIIEILQGEDN